MEKVKEHDNYRRYGMVPAIFFKCSIGFFSQKEVLDGVGAYIEARNLAGFITYKFNVRTQRPEFILYHRFHGHIERKPRNLDE